MATPNRTDQVKHQAPAADDDAAALALWERWQRAGAGYFCVDDARAVVARLGQMGVSARDAARKQKGEHSNATV